MSRHGETISEMQWYRFPYKSQPHCIIIQVRVYKTTISSKISKTIASYLKVGYLESGSWVWEMYCAQRINPTDFGNVLTLTLVPGLG